MATLVINTSNQNELNLLKSLLKQMRIKSKELKAEEEEDFLLGQIMVSEKTGKTVSKDTIIKKLKGK
ncbi:MAG: hypothetical protein HYU67_04560 [Flavobacteriia bacterium]|nr:hypothetical protein [Flavobacteriia bacterium]